jgi:hypothetical protein
VSVPTLFPHIPLYANVEWLFPLFPHSCVVRFEAIFFFADGGQSGIYGKRYLFACGKSGIRARGESSGVMGVPFFRIGYPFFSTFSAFHFCRLEAYGSTSVPSCLLF